MVIVMIAMLASSCKTGYGCKGTGKHITRYKGEKYIGY